MLRPRKIFRSPKSNLSVDLLSALEDPAKIQQLANANGKCDDGWIPRREFDATVLDDRVVRR